MFASRIALAVALVAAPLAGSLALPGAALARGTADDEVVTTAAARATRPPTEAELAKAQADAKAKADADRAAKPVTTQDQVAAWLAGAPPIERVDDGPSGYAMRPALDVNGYPLGPDGKRQIHGEAGVSIGTGGYRSGYVSSLIPIGENSTLGVAVSQTDFGKHGGYGYGGYGYGYGGYGGYGDGYGRRGGTSQSLALSLDMRGGSGRKSDTPEGCAPGFRDGDRYIEPVWVTEMRGDRGCAAAAPGRP
uniref:Uncharacterized protein n=1 Tax=Caulobacter sp. (strain K31) TaxID=366602 RepID=B0T5C3_CAUSK